MARHGDDVIPDSRMKASSEDLRHPASRGRLKDSGWAPRSTGKDQYPYLLIDLVNLYLVCGFKVQGCSDFKGKPAWVTRYRVQVSPEKNFWDSWNYIKVRFILKQDIQSKKHCTLVNKEKNYPVSTSV